MDARDKKFVIGQLAFGLRHTRQIVDEAGRVVKGKTNSYAKGWRAAIREIRVALTDELKRN